MAFGLCFCGEERALQAANRQEYEKRKSDRAAGESASRAVHSQTRLVAAIRALTREERGGRAMSMNRRKEKAWPVRQVPLESFSSLLLFPTLLFHHISCFP